MPLSTIGHQNLYIESPTTPQRLTDVRILLDAVRQLPIGLPLKRTILRHSIWQVSEATGGYYSRYRSARVTQEAGLNIQRDHIFTIESLIGRCLVPEPDIDGIIAQAHCCIVFEDEHQQLHEVDPNLTGWDRYREAGIIVYDMLDRTEVV